MSAEPKLSLYTDFCRENREASARLPGSAAKGAGKEMAAWKASGAGARQEPARKGETSGPDERGSVPAGKRSAPDKRTPAPVKEKPAEAEEMTAPQAGVSAAAGRIQESAETAASKAERIRALPEKQSSPVRKTDTLSGQTSLSGKTVCGKQRVTPFEAEPSEHEQEGSLLTAGRNSFHATGSRSASAGPPAPPARKAMKKEYGEDTQRINRYVDETIDYFTIKNPALMTALERGLMKKELFQEEVVKHIHSFPLTEDEKQRVYASFSSFVWTYDVIDPLIEDADISDIKILSPDRIRVKRHGKREDSDAAFRSSSHYTRFVKHIAAKNKINLSNRNALQSFTDKDSSPGFRLRFNITTEFINSTQEPYVHIRKIPKAKKGIEELTKMGMMSEQEAEYLAGAARADAGMLFCGKGASGKTTCMNALLEQIPHDKSCLAIQENEELFSDSHPDFMFQHTVENQGEGKIRYGLEELARNGLLTDLDYFIIGEIKGAEALYFLNAEYTGHRAWASVHANGAKEAFYKLADYIKYASDYSLEDILKMLLNIRTIVFLKDFKVLRLWRLQALTQSEGM